MNKNIRFSWLLVIALPLIASLAIDTVHSAATSLYLDPELIYASPGESFTVDIKVADVLDTAPLYSWQVYISFNSSVLEFVNVTEGDFLIDQPEGTMGQLRSSEGWAMFGWSTKGRYVGIPGSGTLGTVEFNVVGTGECVLNITSPYSFLLKTNPPPVPPQGEFTEDLPFTPVNGFFTNLAVPPTASFTYSPSSPGIGETLTFDASASSDPDGTIIRYEWDFDDGESENTTAAVVTHEYDAAATYTVTLKVFDDSELYGTFTDEITIRSAHDLAVIDVTTSKTIVTAGEAVSIEVTVLNEGTETESFDIEAYYNNHLIDTQPVTELGSGANETLTFSWDTSGVEKGTYTISAKATEVAGETDTEDNTREDGTVRVEVSEPSFPTTLVVAAVVVVVVLAVGVFLYMRRR